ncbi:MAG: OmpA family protein [Saprospiraceae bacterium]|nr:OmpA family protein [Saprospiraceae bacterium]
MKKSHLLTGLLVFCITLTLQSQTILQHAIYFDSDASEINAEGETAIQNLKNDLLQFTEFQIEVIGHTDQDGSEAYNLKLSEKRANAVQASLIASGIASLDIDIAFRGEAELLFNDFTSTSKKQNRRVIIKTTGYTYENAEELISQLKMDASNNKHIIDQTQESVLTLIQGTQVTIPQEAFCKMDGSPLENQSVNLEFKEAFEYLDMVDQSLFTQTDNQLLETGGMVYISASQNGTPVRLKEGKSLELLLPEQELKDGMELFLGKQDEEGMIWEETGEEITTRKEAGDSPFIQVDLSPIIEFDFNRYKGQELSFAPMPPYPSRAKKVYPPFHENYTEEAYPKALKKYEDAKNANELVEQNRPSQLKAWKKEASKRKARLFEHKRNTLRNAIVKKLKVNIAQLVKDKDRISHDRLVKVLFGFLNKEVKVNSYDEWNFLKHTYGKEIGSVRKEIGIEFPRYQNMERKWFVKEFSSILMKVERQITAELYASGYIDEDVVSRYVVVTSDLGWINCDRFIELNDNEKMDLEFAATSSNSKYYLVFKGIRSLIKPKREDQKIVFKDVPRGEDVRLIALKVEDSDAYIAAQDFTTGANRNMKFVYKSADVKDIKSAFAGI